MLFGALRTAICGELVDTPSLAVFNEFPRLDADDPPEWVKIIPAGVGIKALDGRVFDNPYPDKVIARFEADPRDLPVDLEHATEIKAPKGDPAPAVGWIYEIQNRAGALWAHVRWTVEGAQLLKNKAYRYISPAFLHKGKEVVEIVSAGLTNRPALDLPQLARKQNQGSRAQEQGTMNPKLLALLGLKADASEEDVLKAATQLQIDVETFRSEAERKQKDLDATMKALEESKVALASAQKSEPSLDRFVPRADYDAVVARAEAAEKQIVEADKAARDEKIEALIKKGLDDGKITPSTQGFYRAQCEKDGGIELFSQFLEDAPVVAPPSKLGNKAPTKKPDGAELSEDQLQILSKCSISKEDYLKAIGA